MSENELVIQVNDHEDRLRNLEKMNYQQEIRMTSIESGIQEIKKNQFEQFNKLLEHITNQDVKKTDIKIWQTKEVWGLIALVIGGALTYFKIG